VSQPKSQSTLAIPSADRALEDLLGTLLAEVPEHVEPATPVNTGGHRVTAVENVPVRVEADPPPLSLDNRVLNNAPGAPIENHVQLELPQWAEEEFKLLLVRMGPLRFAVPLVCLNSIAQLDDQAQVTKIPAQPTWHRGVTLYRDQQLTVVGLTELLKLHAGEMASRYVLVIGEGRFGLACDAIEEQVSVTSDQVKWRQVVDKREWLLGMLPEQMCILLDLDEVARRLQRAL